MRSRTFIELSNYARIIPLRSSLWGLLYLVGKGVERNRSKAAEYFRKAADQGHASAQYCIGQLYHSGEDSSGGKERTIWDLIETREKNSPKAVEWYRKAADQGHAHAQYELGLAYQSGEGVEKNRNKAAEYFRKAADQGHAHAQYAIGEAYRRGEGVEKNLRTAEEWFQKDPLEEKGWEEELFDEITQ
jgi:uncharacterized protein